MPRLSSDNPLYWRHAVERAREAAQRLENHPDLRLRMLKIAARYKRLEKKANGRSETDGPAKK